MKDVCLVNIHPPCGKKNCGKHFLFLSRDIPDVKDDIDIPNIGFLTILCNLVNPGTK